MAAVTGWSCHTCHDAEDGVAYVTPSPPVLPGLRFAVGKEETIMPPLQADCQQHHLLCAVRGGFFGDGSSTPLRSICCQPPGRAGGCGAVNQDYVAGFQPEFWSELFRDSLEIPEPLLPWLNQQLSVLCGAAGERWMWHRALSQ